MSDKTGKNESIPIVLIVDDVIDNLAVLHDALDESGYTVLVAQSGKSALDIARQTQPKVILLDAMMPEMDGFQVCKALKASMVTSHIPVIFMTGLTDADHVAMAFDAGGTDYVTKPVRPKEVLARIAAHMQTAMLMSQTRSALDAFGQAGMAVTPHDGKIVWRTPLANQWLQNYFPELRENNQFAPASVLHWLQSRETNNQEDVSMSVISGGSRLIFSLIEDSHDEFWTLILREESDSAQIEALLEIFNLTKRESEVLYWAIKGKTSRDIGDILETSPRTINKHLEHIFAKLGVETRTAAATLAISKLRSRFRKD
jgi:CheY-like chemotaxis protein/DNA-binding CsgD family transcriptional regulator